MALLPLLLLLPFLFLFMRNSSQRAKLSSVVFDFHIIVEFRTDNQDSCYGDSSEDTTLSRRPAEPRVAGATTTVAVLKTLQQSEVCTGNHASVIRRVQLLVALWTSTSGKMIDSMTLSVGSTLREALTGV